MHWQLRKNLDGKTDNKMESNMAGGPGRFLIGRMARTKGEGHRVRLTLLILS